MARHLLDTSSTPCCLSRFFTVSYRFPDRSSIPGGSIEKVPASLIDPWYLVDQSSFCSWIWWVVPQYLLDNSTIDDLFLDTYLDSFLDTFRHLHLSSFTEGLYIHSSWSDSHFFDLSRSVRTYSSPKHYLSHSKPLPLWFFKLFQDFHPLVSFLSLILHAFHVLKLRFWGFWKILGFFKIDELLLKFWDGFSLKWV